MTPAVKVKAKLCVSAVPYGGTRSRTSIVTVMRCAYGALAVSVAWLKTV